MTKNSKTNTGIFSKATEFIVNNPLLSAAICFTAGNASRGLGYKAPLVDMIENICDSTGLVKAKPGSLAATRIAAQKAAAGQVGFLSIDTMESIPNK